MKPLQLLSILLPAALLASCGGGDQGADDGRSSSGEVLEGTISDTMLPLDSLRSEAPLAAPVAATTGGPPADDGVSEEGAEGEDGAADEAAAADAPAPAAEEPADEGA